MTAPSLAKATGFALEGGKKRVRDEILRSIVRTGEPHGDLRARDVFTYALVICSAYQQGLHRSQGRRNGTHFKETDIDQLDPLFQFAEKMQRRDGHFRWFWKDRQGEIDTNAVEFCMRGAALMCQPHHQGIIRSQAPESWRALERMVKRSMRACWRAVPERFSNIALMNAGNLILLGQALNWPHVAEEGYKRLQRIYIYTYEWGVHEYCSPTYSAIQLNCLGLICAYGAQDTEGAKAAWYQARQLLKLFLMHVALNWHQRTVRLGGTHSRKLSDYLQGDGRIDETLWAAGWAKITPESSEAIPMRVIYPALAGLRNQIDSAPEVVRECDAIFHCDGKLEYRRKKRLLIRQSWGPSVNEARAHSIYKGISLSTSSAGYDYPNYQDMPLTVDFIPGASSDVPRPAKSVPHNFRWGCYFVSDIDHDPYGRDARHFTPLHWAATQDRDDALALALYEPALHKHLESHFVLPSDVDRIWINDEDVTAKIRPSEPAEDAVQAGGTAGVVLCGFQRPIERGDTVFLENEKAAVGIKAIWTRSLAGREAPVAFCCDAAPEEGHENDAIRAVRLTVQHHLVNAPEELGAPRTDAGVVFWVRIYSGSDSDRWRAAFQTAQPERCELQPSADDGGAAAHIQALDVVAKSGAGELLRIETKAEGGRRFATRLLPTPTQAVRSVNDDTRDEGRALLAGEAAQEMADSTPDEDSWQAGAPSLIRSYKQQLQALPAVEGAFSIESARVWPPMLAEREGQPWGTTFAWLPPAEGRRYGSNVGSVSWRLGLDARHIKDRKPHYLWGRVLAPNSPGASYRVRLFHQTCNGEMWYPPISRGSHIESELEGARAAISYPYLFVWHSGAHREWTWVPMNLSKPGASPLPTPLFLYKDTAVLQLFARRTGIKIDQVCLTDRSDFVPGDMLDG